MRCELDRVLWSARLCLRVRHRRHFGDIFCKTAKLLPLWWASPGMVAITRFSSTFPNNLVLTTRGWCVVAPPLLAQRPPIGKRPHPLCRPPTRQATPSTDLTWPQRCAGVDSTVLKVPEQRCAGPQKFPSIIAACTSPHGHQKGELPKPNGVYRGLDPPPGSVLMLSRTKKYSNSSCLKVVFNVLQIVVVDILS